MSADHGSSHGHDGPPLPPEPKTPMWLPALGAALFLLVGLWWATRPEPPAPIVDDTADAAAADAGAAPQQAAQAAPGQGQPGQAGAQQAARPNAPPPGRPGAPGSVDASAPLSPEQAAQLQKILKGMGH